MLDINRMSDSVRDAPARRGHWFKKRTDCKFLKRCWEIIAAAAAASEGPLNQVDCGNFLAVGYPAASSGNSNSRCLTNVRPALHASAGAAIFAEEPPS